MKTLLLIALSLVSANVYAESLTGTDDVQVPASLVEGYRSIPSVGSLSGSVVSVYAGTAYGRERYLVTVGNTDAPCEGDDCIAQKTFEIDSGFQGTVKAVYSRKIDANHYSIALMVNALDVNLDDGSVKSYPAKILLRVKFNAEGVNEEATMKVVKL